MTKFENVEYLYRKRYTYSTISNIVILHNYLPMKMEQTVCSETLAYKILTQGNYPEESIQHSEHSESLKSRKIGFFFENRLCI